MIIFHKNLSDPRDVHLSKIYSLNIFRVYINTSSSVSSLCVYYMCICVGYVLISIGLYQSIIVCLPIYLFVFFYVDIHLTLSFCLSINRYKIHHIILTQKLLVFFSFSSHVYQWQCTVGQMSLFSALGPTNFQNGGLILL